MHDTSRDAKPDLVVGVQADGVVEDLFREVGVVAGDSAPGGEPVDLYRVDPNDKGLSQHRTAALRHRGVDDDPRYRRALFH